MEYLCIEVDEDYIHKREKMQKAISSVEIGKKLAIREKKFSEILQLTVSLFYHL